MKLNPIVASLCAMGLTTSVALAGAAAAKNGGSQATRMQAMLDQNQSQAFSFAKMPMKGWADRVTVSGIINADLKTADYMPTAADAFATKTHHKDINVSNANVYVDAAVNAWATAHMGIDFWGGDADINSQYHPNATASTAELDEVFVTVANFAKSPFYARVGRQYVDFGSYYQHPITTPLTQMLSMTRADALTVGYADASGFGASVYTFDGTAKSTDTSTRELNNWGLHLGYDGSYSGVGFNVAADYMRNMIDVNFLSDATGAGTYVHKVAGYSLHAGAKFNQFDAAIDWVSAAKRFDSTDYESSTANQGLKPSAWGVDLGFKADVGMPARFGAGYQRSKQAYDDATGSTTDNLMKSRWYVQAGTEIAKNSDLTLQVRRDKNYNTNANGDTGNTGQKNTAAVLRLGVRFA